MQNREVVTEWVKRLRSGDYAQGDGKLAKVVEGKVQHCCLGVLCEIAAENGVTTKDQRMAVGGDVIYFGGRDGLPPLNVRYFAGLDDDLIWMVNIPHGLSARIDEDFGNEDDTADVEYEVSLTALNDEYGFTFEQIAGLLEKQFLS